MSYTRWDSSSWYVYRATNHIFVIRHRGLSDVVEMSYDQARALSAEDLRAIFPGVHITELVESEYIDRFIADVALENRRRWLR